jgi:hypothetical protein
MKTVRELRKKAAGRTRKKTQVYSTSEARANFAEALETAQIDNAVIGFDRYGRTIAALVPVEAVYILAGEAHRLAPGVREEIERGAAQFVESVPTRVAERAKPPKRTTRAPKKASKAQQKAKKRARTRA